jgi:hypothetical protein
MQFHLFSFQNHTFKDYPVNHINYYSYQTGKCQVGGELSGAMKMEDSAMAWNLPFSQLAAVNLHAA